MYFYVKIHLSSCTLNDSFFYPLAILKSSPSLIHAELPNTGISHNVEEAHSVNFTIDLIKSLRNTNFPKFRFSLENLNFITGNGNRLTLLKFKKMSMKYSSMNNNHSVHQLFFQVKIMIHATGSVPTHKRIHFFKPVTLDYSIQQQGSMDMLHFIPQNSKETFTRGLSLIKISNFECFIQDILKWKWFFVFFFKPQVCSRNSIRPPAVWCRCLDSC